MPSTAVVNRCLSATSTSTSSAGGVINTIFSLAPNGYTGWTGLAAAYDEFRVLGGSVTISSVFNNGTLLNNSVAVVVYDNDDTSTALTSIDQAIVYPERLIFPSFMTPNLKVFRFNCYSLGDRSTGIPWTTCATPTALPKSIKFYTTGLTVNLLYWNIVFQLAVQFRGPQ